MTLRQPRANLIVNGQTLLCAEIEVEMSRDQKSDCFRAKVPMDKLPAGMDANWWSTAANISVQVMVDAGQGATKIFDGQADEVEHDFSECVLDISGRDKSSKLIDNKASSKFLNKKPHEIVQQIAGDAGIDADVDAVTDKAGKLFQIDYNAIQHRLSGWSMILQLADLHGRVAYMTAGKLYFKDPAEKLPTLKIVYSPPTSGTAASSNAIRIRARRSITLGRPVKHTVHSWNHKQAALNEGTYTEPGDGDELEWHHHHPGLSKDQATRRAKDHCDRTTRHEFGITIDMPGDPTVTPRFMLDLSGTGTAYDQQHELTHVRHRMSERDGYRMSVDTKAKSKKRGKH